LPLAQARHQPPLGHAIAYPREPRIKLGCSLDCEHGFIVIERLHMGNGWSLPGATARGKGFRRKPTNAHQIKPRLTHRDKKTIFNKINCLNANRNQIDIDPFDSDSASIQGTRLKVAGVSTGNKYSREHIRHAHHTPAITED
jgi:hypothetical protein